MHRMLLTLALAATTALAQTAPQTPAAPTAPADPNTVVARVGDETITLGEYERQYRIYVGRIVNQQGVPFSEDVLSFFAQYRTDILNQLVRSRGLVQLANAAGLQSDATKVDATIAENKQEFGSDEEFTDALQQSGYPDEAAFRQAVTEGLLTGAFVDSLRERFKFGPAVLRAYYVTHKADYTKTAQACVKHILVADEAAAKTVRDRLAGGEEFAKIASEVSQDPGSKDEGGDLGCFEQGQTVPEFDQAAFTGPLNTLQQVTTQFGVHVLQVSQRTSGGVASFEEAEPDIRNTLANLAAEKYLDAKLKGVKIETFADVVAAPAAPTDPAAPAQPKQP
ncbi:peptidylprolyl isomerase [Deinococcus yavapaiensis]|uniref:Peptidyl-prolyl cis-trans isomerase C n=1 Tax=Deinococcus yavapaiensis KR-236 TaxID=694435 RepID=A0A318S896_9DEIO|nr:peptidylprolyl isomerase [Deinococcus yavapaiensis]PYE54755.1 peptidyl-prolyl cis-trans isomerase C [Deinococcus yavapaiensis KR-236]